MLYLGTAIVIPVAIAVVSIVTATYLIFFHWAKKNEKSKVDKQEDASNDVDNGNDSTFTKIGWCQIYVSGGKTAIIGQGSYGVVVRAHYTRRDANGKVLGRPLDVAVKVILRSSTVNLALSGGMNFAEVTQEAIEEAKNVIYSRNRVAAPEHILHVYGVVIGTLPDELIATFGLRPGDEAVGIVTRFEQGGSLEDMLHPVYPQPEIPLALEDNLALLRDTFTALSDLHAIGIVHGDMKPGNLLLSSNNIKKCKVVVGDFGQSKLKDYSKLGLGASTLRMTSTVAGTPIYSAVEMLANPLDDEGDKKVCVQSRKTDIYAMAVLSWQILARKKPYSHVSDAANLSVRVHRGERPSLSDLPANVPSSIRDMIKDCWSVDRRHRWHAAECLAVVEHALYNLSSGTFDIFCSHAWKNKPFVSNLYRMLTACGYKIWYDLVDMGNNIIDSMREGIEKSQVFLVVLNSLYQTRENCMFELTYARSLGKPVIAVIIEADPLSWANDSLRQQMPGWAENKMPEMFVPLHEIATRPEWESDLGPGIALQFSLREEIVGLIKLVENAGCYPSLMSHKLVRSLCCDEDPLLAQTEADILASSMSSLNSNLYQSYDGNGSVVIHETKCMRGHTSDVNYVIQLLDGRICTASDDEMLKVWNLNDEHCEFTLHSHDTTVWILLQLSDGRVVSGSRDKTVKIWNTSSQTCEETLKGHTSTIYSLCELRDGRLLSGSWDHCIRVWNLISFDCESTFVAHEGYNVACMVQLKDDRLCSCSDDHTIKIWNIHTFECDLVLRGHTEDVNFVLELPDCRLASVSNDCTLRIWNQMSGVCERSIITHDNYVYCVIQFSENKIATSSNDKTIKIWDTDNWECKTVLQGHTAGVSSIKLLKDGRVCSVSMDMTIRLWDIPE